MKQVLIIVIAMAIGAVSFWAFSPYFIHKEVQDELDPALAARLEAQRKVDEARQNSLPAETAEPVATKPIVEETAVSETSVAESYGIQSRGPFPITGTPQHPATGAIEVIESPEEKLVYYKDYDGTNGPDLKVYLSKDLEATEIFDLGDARGSRGNLIYGVPLGVDLSEYKYVLTWCEAFGVLFDYAEIN